MTFKPRRKITGLSDASNAELFAIQNELARELAARSTRMRLAESTIDVNFDDVVRARPTTAGMTIRAPVPSVQNQNGRFYVLLLGTAGACRIVPKGGTVNGLASLSLVAVGLYEFFNDAEDWYCVTVAAGAIGNAQLADMAARRIKGRADSAGTGEPQDLTGAQVGSILRFAQQATTQTGSGTVAALVVPSGANIQRFDPTGTLTVRSFEVPGEVGQFFFAAVTTGGGDTVVFNNEDAAELTAGRRIRTPNGENYSVDINSGIVMFVYLSISGLERWWLIPVVGALFTATLRGLVPASGGGTVNFLRADGTWAAPGGGSGGEIAKSRHVLTADFSLAALETAVVPDYFNPATFVLTLGAGATFAVI